MATGTAAATLVVAADGTGDFPTIQAAVNAASDNSVIELLDGTFTGDGNRDVIISGKDLIVRSQGNDPAACVIDLTGTLSHRAFRLDQSISTLKGLTIRNGSADQGGAVFSDWYTHTTIEDCIVEGNSATDKGGGIFSTHFPPVGGGFVIRRTIIRGNVAPSGAGAWGAGTVFHVDDSQIVNNVALTGGGIAGGDCRVLLSGSTVSGNTGAIEGGGIFVEFDSFVTSVRSIVWDNCAPLAEDIGAPTATFLCSIVDTTGIDAIATYDSTTVAVDPQFCSSVACDDSPSLDGDYRLRASSPALPGASPCGQLIGAAAVGCEQLVLDLAAIAIVCMPDTAWSGPGGTDSLVVGGIFSNLGNAAASGFSVRLSVDGCGDGLSQVSLVPPLAPGEKDTILVGPFAVVAAECIATLIVDELEQIMEVDETNNALVDVPVCGVVDAPESPFVPAAVTFRVFPNPAGGTVRFAYGTPSVGITTITIYDVAGRHVWSRTTDLEGGIVSWDRTTDSGRVAAPGIYFVRFRTEGKMEVGRVVLTE